MAKKPRKHKQYRGKDSSLPPQVIRFEAPDRSRLQQWWHDQRTNVVIRAIQLVAVLIVVGFISWLV